MGRALGAALREALASLGAGRRAALSTAPSAVIFTALCAAWLAGGEARGQESLPAGPARTLLLEACVQCHDLRAVSSQRKDARGWRRTVNEMIWRGAPLLPGEAEEVSAYLAAHFGPTPELPSSGASPARSSSAAAPPASAARAVDRGPDPGEKALPPGPGRPLVLRACVGCHDLGTTISQRRTAEGWRRSVDQMVRLGARLEPGEAAVLAEYLARALGPAAEGGTKGKP